MQDAPASYSTALGELWLWLLKLILAWVPILAPAVAYIVTVWTVEGSAETGYFDLVAQILPILVLALAVEQRYFFKEPRLPRPPSTPTPLPQRGYGVLKIMYRVSSLSFGLYRLLAYIYPLVILAALSRGEFQALRVAATGHVGESDLQSTAASLVAGFTALVFSLLTGKIRADADSKS